MGKIQNDNGLGNWKAEFKHGISCMFGKGRGSKTNELKSNHRIATTMIILLSDLVYWTSWPIRA